MLAVFSRCSLLIIACGHCLQGVSVEAVDPVFQAKMLDMLKQTGRSVILLLLHCCGSCEVACESVQLNSCW